MTHNIIKGRYLNYSIIFVFLCMIILIVTGCNSSDSNTPPDPGEDQLLYSGTGPDTVIDTIDVRHQPLCDDSDDSHVPLCDVKHPPLGVAASPDGSHVYVTISGIDVDEVVVINTSDRSIERKIDVGNGPKGIAVLPDGSYIYVANHLDDTVSVIDITDYSVFTIAGFDNPTGIAVSPDGNYVYVTNYLGNNVSVIDTADNTLVSPNVTVGVKPTGIAVSPDGNWVYVANEDDDSVSVIDTTSMSVKGLPITVGNGPNGVAVTLDGRHVYVANSEGIPNPDYDPAVPDNSDNPIYIYTISVIDTNDDSVTTITEGDTPTGIAVSPDGVYMYVTNYTGDSVSVINANDVNYEGEILLGYEGAKPLGIAMAYIASTDTVYAYVANKTINAVTVIE